MKRLYEKNEFGFAIMWIVLYVVLFSIADSISAFVGVVKVVTAPLCIAMTVFLWVWIARNGLKEKYGLCMFKGNKKHFLYFLPLLVVATSNVWFGVTMNLSVRETLLYVISMLCVGFLEEVIFRGFLFKVMCKDNVTRAILISSITFGMGHIVNLLNGAELVPTLIQICYATTIGYLFTIIFYKGKSLWPCIMTHGIINSLSVFAVERDDAFVRILTLVVLTVVPVGYAVWIIRKERGELGAPADRAILNGRY